VTVKKSDFITPSQCRAARALLDMTQPELAERSGLGLSTIVDFEKSRREVSDRAIAELRSALERAGVRFVRQDTAIGVMIASSRK
jgi:transcriptional regulator with XRE-family HTH domain